MSHDHVDFQAIARRAVEAGLFRVNEAAFHANLGVRNPYARLPVTWLDAPYGNGPIAIRIFRKDVPEASVFALRRNYTAATSYLLPLNELLLYFHERATNDDIFDAESLARLVDQYQAPDVDPYHAAATDPALGKGFQDPTLSFRFDGVDRHTRDRRLYTREERIAGLELAQDQPAVVLAIFAYQAVIQDYLSALRTTFAAMALQEEAPLGPKDLDDLDKYAVLWSASNFVDEIIPALALFRRRRRASVPRSLIDATLFQQAVDFAVSNGVFRHWVTVPSEIADDGKERVNHFLCPAAGAIRAQLRDGHLLAALHEVAAQRIASKDAQATSYVERLRAQMKEKLDRKDWTPSPEELEQLDQRKRVNIRYRGTEVVLRLDGELPLLLLGSQQEKDLAVSAPTGSWFFDVMGYAIRMAIEHSRSVYFDFNGTGYRVTPELLEEALEAASHSG